MTDRSIYTITGHTNAADILTLADAQAVFASVVTPERFGAIGDGVTDDTAAIQSALNAGGNVYFHPGRTYAISQTLAVGNGTSTTVSTINGISLIGSTSGATASEFGPAVRPTCIKWIGASGGTMMVVAGPIVGVNARGLFFDCNNLASTACYHKHMLASTWQDIVGARYIGTCFIREAYPAVGGVFVNGSQKNTFINFRAKNPGTGGRGLRLGVTSGYVNSMLDVAQDVYISCEFYRDGADSTSFSIQLSFCDNITFIESPAWSQGGTLGAGVYILPPTGTGNFARFPQEITFLNCPILGSFTVDAAWAPVSGIVCFPFPTADGEPIPTNANIVGMDCNGRWFGNSARALSSSIVPANNGDMVTQLTSNTSLTFKVKGSDGVVRSASLTLS